jgi:hypothetical protein
VAYRRQRKSNDSSQSADNDLNRELRNLRQENGRLKAKLSLTEKKYREITLPVDKPSTSSKSKAGVGSAAGLGVAASGTKEVLDWLWEIMRPQAPYLYDFLHLDGVDAGIMAMITSFFVWIGGR